MINCYEFSRNVLYEVCLMHEGKKEDNEREKSVLYASHFNKRKIFPQRFHDINSLCTHEQLVLSNDGSAAVLSVCTFSILFFAASSAPTPSRRVCLFSPFFICIHFDIHYITYFLFYRVNWCSTFLFLFGSFRTFWSSAFAVWAFFLLSFCKRIRFFLPLLLCANIQLSWGI